MMAGSVDLQRRVALVTGGGRRLGRGITQALAEAGCRVIIHYGRSRRDAESTVEDLLRQGTEAMSLAADLAAEAQIEAMFETVNKRFGRLDVLVNSAASFHKQSLTTLDAADWDRAMGVNLRAPFLCLRAATPLMRAAARLEESPAAVVNVGDLSGVLAWPGYAHHGASKAGLLHLTKVAARELAPEIRVNAVIPGPILPPPGADATDEGWRGLLSSLPMARPGLPSEVGAAVVFLAANDFITGEAIRVDGGEHLLGAGHRQL